MIDTSSVFSLTDAGTLSVQLTASIGNSSDSATSSALTEEVDSAVGEVTDGGTTVYGTELNAMGADQKSSDSLQLVVNSANLLARDDSTKEINVNMRRF